MTGGCGERRRADRTRGGRARPELLGRSLDFILNAKEVIEGFETHVTRSCYIPKRILWLL